MTCEEYKDMLFKAYSPLKLLSKRNGSEIISVRNNSISKDMVIRIYSTPITAYDTLKMVRHENFPEVYDSLAMDDGQIILEEYIDGITVADVLESGLYTYRGAVNVLYGVLSALSFLHSEGIVHRDVKPENIIITRNGKVKLIDLGASRTSSKGKRCDTVPLGTVGYAPPEQYGISESDSKADIYAVGILLNVMLTGEHPSAKLAKGRAKDIVLKCTSVSPEKRFSSVEKLMRAL